MNHVTINPGSATSWNSFVLAATAPLGPFREVHLAPNFPTARINLALRTDLPLDDDELLVGLVERDFQGFQSEIVLTTRRLYWLTQDKEDDPAPGGGRRRSPVLRKFGLDYALIGENVRVTASPTGVSRIELGEGRVLPLPEMPEALVEELAKYLKRVGDAARTGLIPPDPAIPPELEARVAAVLPDVVAVTDKIRGLSRDLSSFRRQLLTMTPRVMVTPALAIACVIVFALMTISGVHPFFPLQSQLLAWGANEGSRVVLRHEYWRLPASVFAHAGLLHLAFNMWCLVMIGPLIERLFGNLAALLIFLTAGIGGAIASTISLPFRVSVGASGAIFGIFGALLALFLIHRKSIPASVLRPLRSSVMSFVIFNMLLGAAMPGIDQAAHMGGLVTGFVAGLLLCPPWPPARTPRIVLRRSFMGVALVGLLITVGNLAIRYRAQAVPPAALYEDFSEQIASSIDAYNRISSAIPGTPPSRSGDAEANAPARLTEHFKALRSQAVANLERLEHVTTPDPDLQAALHTLISGQLAQRGILDTLIQPPDDAKAPDNNRTATEHYVAQANEAIHEFEEKREAYLVRHHLKEDGPPAVK